MQDERTYKRGQLAELQDESKEILAKTRADVQALRQTFDDAVNLPWMDLDMAAVLVKEMQKLKTRYQEVTDRITVLSKELNLP